MRPHHAFAALLLCLLCSCATTEPLTTVGEIRGKQWRLQSFDLPDGKRFSLPSNAPPYTLQFDSSNRVGLRWNCNAGGGIYALQQPNFLRIDSLITTLRGCEDNRFKDKVEYNDDNSALSSQIFSRNCTYNSDDNRLRIWYDNNTKSADFVRVR